jgi:predicted nucleic acid-binding Zn ribbon protein
MFKTLSGTAEPMPTRASRIARTRRRDGAHRLTSPASRRFSRHARRTSSPAPPFPSVANSRSWGEVLKRKLRSLRTFYKTIKPRTMPGLFTDGAGN